MWWNLSKLWRRGTWREEDTRRALEEPVPQGTEAFPLDVPLGAWAALAPAGHLAVILVVAAASNILFGFYWNPIAIALIAAGFAVTLVSAVYSLSTAGWRTRIAEDGVRLQRVVSTEDLPWWRVRGVETDRKLSSIRFLTESGSSRLSTTFLKPDRRKDLILAIRARAEPRQIPVTLQPKYRISTPAGVTALSVTGTALVFLGLFLAGLNTSFALGIRCSVASQYLRTRFDTAEHRGCVVVRVSGAAERAGIHQGDLMIEMNGIPITSGEQFSEMFRTAGTSHFRFTMLRSGVGEPLHFDVYPRRGGKAPHTPKSDALFYYLRARWDAAAGKVDGPIADYTKAIELAPDFDLAYVYRASLHTELPRNLSAAEKDITAALQLSPDIGEVHRYAAYVYRDEGRQADALQQVQRAIELDQCEGGFTQYNVDCAKDYDTLTTLLGAFDSQAVALTAERSIEFYGGFPNVYYNAAWAYAALGEQDRALARSRAYLAFPKSRRDPLKSWEMTYLLTPPGTPVPPPPKAPPYLVQP